MKKKGSLLVVLAFLLGYTASTQTWIWYPGDYEIWLSNQMQNRRTDRGVFFPVFWKVDSHYNLMDFHKVYTLSAPETIHIYVEGQYNVKLDGKPIDGTPKTLLVPAGKHKINIKVFNQASVPTVFVKGKTIVSDASWLTTFEDKEWIDETGKTSDVSATKWLSAGSWNFNSPTALPSAFKLPTKPLEATQVTTNSGSRLYDFGKETFGFIKLHGLQGKGRVTIYYGESKEEALDKNEAVTIDVLDISNTTKKDSTMVLSKAFRYVQIVTEGNVSYSKASALYEYADIEDKGSFTCNDAAINKIYDVAKYTLHLSTREFFIDGIKRDRWVWSGDAYQSYLMNYYLMNDNATVTRTMYALRGKDPVTGHINTIMDYTFYWFLSIYDYYLFTGDKKFIEQNYDKMKSLMDYVMARRNKNGLLEWMPGDWIFIDWAAGLSKKGEVSFEQLLFARSLETMALCADIVKDETHAGAYKKLAAEMRTKLFELYWSKDKQALVHSRIDGAPTQNVTRYANMFSIFFNYFSEAQKQAVKKSVLLNDSIQKITTPYMRFYELESLCAMGEQNYVLDQMKAYWGGMLDLGATSFWEEYNPEKKGEEHYSMYGRRFGKSLCHAWGASPIYLLGKYYLGVQPTAPGFAKYTVTPALGGLQWMEGKVPTPNGVIALKVSTTSIQIQSPTGEGVLRIRSKTVPTGAVATPKENNYYEIVIEKNKSYSIGYAAL